MTFYQSEIASAAAKHGLDADLVAAVVEQESAGLFHAYRYEPGFWKQYLAQNPRYNTRYPHEVSASFGLMQVMYPTAVEHGFAGEPWDLFDPVQNLDIGCAILASLLVWARGQTPAPGPRLEAGAQQTALAAYNGGKGGAASDGPQSYALSVLRRWERLRQRRA